MTDGSRQSGGAELEQALTDLGRHLAYPPTPDVLPAIRSRLRRGEASSLRSSLRLRLMAVAVVAILAGSLTFTALPAARAAIGEWLGLPGVRIATGIAILPSGRLGGSLDLGRRVPLAAARERLAYHLLAPSLPGLGRPDEVYLAGSLPDARVSLLYHARPGLPRAAATGAGLLLTEFQGTVRQVWLGKTVGWRTIPLRLSVGGYPGYWIRGTHVVFWYRTVAGRQFVDPPHLAGNTLLWERGGLILRLESALPRHAALRIAASLR